MKVKNLKLENFKCFEKLEVDFRKINLLLGANSSGKSSMISALLSVIQTEDYPFNLEFNGNKIILGDYNEVVKGNNVSNDINIQIELNHPDKGGSFRNVFIEQQLQFDRKQNQHVVNYFNVIYGSISLQGKRVENRDYKVQLNKEDNKIYEGVYKDFFDFRSDTHLKNFDNDGQLIMDFSLLLDALNKIEFSFGYISPYRIFPDRTHYQKSSTIEEVGKFGENYQDLIIEWELKGDEEFDLLKKALQDLKLLKDIRSNKLAGGRYEIRVKTHSKSVESALADVGSGVGKVLPILVSDLDIELNGSLILSQPEIDLHPNLQALFMDYLVKRSNNDEMQYIMETHSEYMLNRLRLNIVEGKIDAEDVRVYYLENDGESSKITEIKLTKDGRLENVPQGFFDTYSTDVMNIAAKAMG